MSLVEVKGFNALINNKLFFDIPRKKVQEAYVKLEMRWNASYEKRWNVKKPWLYNKKFIVLFWPSKIL